MDATVGKIYSDNCGYCVSMENDWNIMKPKVIKGGVKVLEFETTHDSAKLEDFISELKKKHNQELKYSGVPTLFKIMGGKIEYYNGKRTADEMADWALKNTNSATNGGSKNKRTMKNKRTKKMKKTKRKTKKSCCWF